MKVFPPHKVELGVVISRHGRDIPLDQATSYIQGVRVALDLTARDLQVSMDST
jgi:acylpyruvate hydrolase